MAEDLEEFSRKRDASCDSDNRPHGPTRGWIGIELIMKQVSEHHEPKGIAEDVFEHTPRQEKVLKRDPSDMVPVRMSSEIAQGKERRNSQENQ